MEFKFRMRRNKMKKMKSIALLSLSVLFGSHLTAQIVNVEDFVKNEKFKTLASFNQTFVEWRKTNCYYVENLKRFEFNKNLINQLTKKTKENLEKWRNISEQKAANVIRKKEEYVQKKQIYSNRTLYGIFSGIAGLAGCGLYNWLNGFSSYLDTYNKAFGFAGILAGAFVFWNHKKTNQYKEKEISALSASKNYDCLKNGFTDALTEKRKSTSSNSNSSFAGNNKTKERVNSSNMPISSIWQKTLERKKENQWNYYLDSWKRRVIYKEDCERLKELNKNIPLKKETQLRIMTYNIDEFKEPVLKQRMGIEPFVGIVKDVNPDLLVLQEVRPDDLGLLKKKFPKYKILYAEAVKHPILSLANLILYKNELEVKWTNAGKFEAARQWETRSYAKIWVEKNGKVICLFGTHLEVFDKDVRFNQAQELVDKAKNEPHPCILTGDFNAIRKKDYQMIVGDTTTIWDLMNPDYSFDSSELRMIEENGFKESFDYEQRDNPQFTNWTGKRVDYFYLDKRFKFPTTTYVYISTAHDHLPVILDIDLEKENK